MANFRAKKAGMDLAEQKMLDERYDREEAIGTPERLMVWMHQVVGRDHAKCMNSSWRKLQFWMRDGVILCKLINILRENTGMASIRYQGNAHIPLVAQNNVESFLKGAIEYGVDSMNAFESKDLYESHKSHFCNVVVFLHLLAQMANRNNFGIPYQEL